MDPIQLVEPTRVAHWGYDEHRYFGHRVFEELTGRETLTGLTLLSVVGRRLSPECCAVIDEVACAVTLADPRIWPLKLTRVIASYGAALPAAAAGLLVEEGARIGPWAGVQAAELLVALREQLGTRAADPPFVREVVHRYLAEHHFVWGFGTPFRDRDERLVSFRACMRRRGRDTLPYWTTMEVVTPVVREARQVEPNISAAFAATFLDMGLDPYQVGALASSIMHHMFVANALEGAARPGPLRQLPDPCVRYVGRGPRPSPRAGLKPSR
ncbi:MAG: hypothetical protein JW940_10850 [Polyangiaceae bacterium]|nr:hypothetical protein [Polyangiaceae bacterium]